MDEQSVPEFVGQGLQSLGLTCDDELVSRLGAYLDLLLTENQKFNLTAVRDRAQAWRRLILDSLTLVPELAQLPAGGSLIDVGSGGGVPGIPIAIAVPSLRVTLLEARGKKAKFLKHCATQLGLSTVRVVHQRAETVGQDGQHRQRYDVAVCRGVGPMRRILEYTLPLVRVGGRVMTIKGSTVEQELDEAGDAMTLLGAGQVQVMDAYLSADEQDAVIVSVEKDRVTPKAYPRGLGIPQQSPL